MTLKNNLNIATLVSSLMGDIFDMSQTVYDVLQTTKRGFHKAEYDFGDGRYISSGQSGRDFRDHLNFAAMVTDYGLAEIFAGLLAATATVQSAAINLSTRGEMSLSGQSVKLDISESADQIATPSLAIQEAIHTTELLLILPTFTKTTVNIVYGIKARVEAAKGSSELEAL
jgi:hypothetical protein